MGTTSGSAPKGRGNRVNELKKDLENGFWCVCWWWGSRQGRLREKQPDSQTHLCLASRRDFKIVHVKMRGFLPLKEQRWPSGVKADEWQVMIMTIYYHP